jgi:hypothetical protein
MALERIPLTLNHTIKQMPPPPASHTCSLHLTTVGAHRRHNLSARQGGRQQGLAHQAGAVVRLRGKARVGLGVGHSPMSRFALERWMLLGPRSGQFL